MRRTFATVFTVSLANGFSASGQDLLVEGFESQRRRDPDFALNIFTMESANELLSDRQANEAYCLAQPRIQYAILFTGEADRRVHIDLSPMHGDVTLAWLDVGKSAWATAQTFRGGGPVGLAPPPAMAYG